MTEPIAAPDREQELEKGLAHLRALLQRRDVEGARAFVKELEAAWPASAVVKKWAWVLAPPRVIGTFPATGRTLEREKQWLRAHAREYPGCWLALDGDRLIAADPDLKKVRAALEGEEQEGVLLHYQPAARL